MGKRKQMNSERWIFCLNWEGELIVKSGIYFTLGRSFQRVV
jgi:hypothetical protein